MARSKSRSCGCLSEIPKMIFGKKNPLHTYYVFRVWSRDGKGRLGAFRCDKSDETCRDYLPSELVSLYPGERGAFTTVRSRNKKAAIDYVRFHK